MIWLGNPFFNLRFAPVLLVVSGIVLIRFASSIMNGCMNISSCSNFLLQSSTVLAPEQVIWTRFVGRQYDNNGNHQQITTKGSTSGKPLVRCFHHTSGAYLAARDYDNLKARQIVQILNNKRSGQNRSKAFLTNHLSNQWKRWRVPSMRFLINALHPCCQVVL